MNTVNKLDSLEVPQPDTRQELAINQMMFYKNQAADYLKKVDDLRNDVAEKYVPQEIEIGKTYTCIPHPNDLTSIFSHAPAMYAKLLKDNMLCLHYRNSDFEHRECKAIKISLYEIKVTLGIVRWEITVENPEGQLFTALYATKMANSPYPRITMDDLFTLLEMSELTPEQVGELQIYIAKNVNGAVCTFVGGVPADWVVKGIPVVPEGVTSWAKFMTNADSKMMNLEDKVFSLDEWLSYCNAT